MYTLYMWRYRFHSVCWYFTQGGFEGRTPCNAHWGCGLECVRELMIGAGAFRLPSPVYIVRDQLPAPKGNTECIRRKIDLGGCELANI